MQPGAPQSARTASVSLKGSPADEVYALQIQNRNLQVLIGELLVKNEQLRLQLAQQEMAAAVNATATPPPPRPDR